MATIQKITIIRYVDRHGNRVSKGTKGAVDRFLSGLDSSARTRDTYRAAIGFCNWLVKKDRIDGNTLEKTTKPKGEAVRVRRALTPEHLQAVLDVTRRRPVEEFSTIRHGKRKGQKGTLQEHVRERLVMLGRERALIYKMAIYTGLRRGEIAELKPAHLHLDCPFA